MTPVPYVPELHFEHIKSWLQHWDEVVTPDGLPQTGYVIPGKAAGFLYRTDSSLAMIENLVAAPGLSKEERNEAVDLIVAAICTESARLGFKILLGTTQLDAVVKRAEKHGFIYVDGGFHVIAKRLY
ncbi:hypothetical protein [Corallococcus macrosporus]|uniref:N-acetyltransferase domain-containing protein n=2 Tax=Myxococcaceae TaxID=31 RepID=A0A250JYV3_9BACT|nr:hypothetical protein [Corallococcus macrosporus]AEI68032.1 hypothetical protein LILAB_30755 [Corallococcus macrosporus]ATB48820.1 hypothetical protein MYMAC_004451 [Corallococcus macrosporus DSM 14697]